VTTCNGMKGLTEKAVAGVDINSFNPRVTAAIYFTGCSVTVTACTGTSELQEIELPDL